MSRQWGQVLSSSLSRAETPTFPSLLWGPSNNPTLTCPHTRPAEAGRRAAPVSAAWSWQLQAPRRPQRKQGSEGQVGRAGRPAGCWEGGRTLQEATRGFLWSLKGPLV